MLARVSLALLASVLASAAPTESQRDIPDNTQPSGTNPIKLAKAAEYLGAQTSSNSCSHRDLGFTGQLAGKWYAVYGDTLWCAPGVTDPAKDDTSKFNGLVRDSISLMGSNVLKTTDLNLNNDKPVAHANQLVPYNTSWSENNLWGFGGTSLCETSTTNQEAILFILRNANDAGLKGAGVARVKLQNNTPTVVQRYGSQGYWWDSSTTARYGDIAAFKDPNSEYVYAWGGAPTNQNTYPDNNYVYQVRVKASEAFDLTKYDYWYGRAGGWKRTPQTTFNKEMAVMWGVGQGQVVYSSYYKLYIYVHLGGKDVLLRTAPSPEGPWTGDVKIYTVQTSSNGYAYAGVAHPYLDTSGKTLTVSYTNYPNNIEAIKVTFQ